MCYHLPLLCVRSDECVCLHTLMASSCAFTCCCCCTLPQIEWDAPRTLSHIRIVQRPGRRADKLYLQSSSAPIAHTDTRHAFAVNAEGVTTWTPDIAVKCQYLRVSRESSDPLEPLSLQLCSVIVVDSML